MSGSPVLDRWAAHRFFSAECFNRTWTLLEKPDRTKEEDEQMLLLAMASLWHWSERSDCSTRCLAVGHWQVSRVYAVLGQGENAALHAARSLEYSRAEPPFFVAYAHEAAARAAMLTGRREEMEHHLAQARCLTEEVENPNDKVALLKDLEEIG